MGCPLLSFIFFGYLCPMLSFSWRGLNFHAPMRRPKLSYEVKKAQFPSAVLGCGAKGAAFSAIISYTLLFA
jgi:hypothetical protein